MKTNEFMLAFWNILAGRVSNKAAIIELLPLKVDGVVTDAKWDQVLTCYERLEDTDGFPGIDDEDIRTLTKEIPSVEGITKTIQRWGGMKHHTKPETFLLYALLFFTVLSKKADMNNTSKMREVLAMCCETISLDFSPEMLELIVSSKDMDLQLATVIVALYYCLDKDEPVAVTTCCEQWYIDYWADTYHDMGIGAFDSWYSRQLFKVHVESVIIRYLWNHLKKGVIDIESKISQTMSKYKAFNLANYYEVPVLTTEASASGSLLESTFPLRTVLRAPSGYGKSTYLAALLLSVTLDTAITLGILTDPVEIEAFKQLRQALIPDSYQRYRNILPIYITGKAYNDYLFSRNGEPPSCFEEIFLSSLPLTISNDEREIVMMHIRDLCSHGKVLFVCDAFDEVYDSYRQNYVTNFKLFGTPAYTQANVIVSYRPIHDAFVFETQNHIKEIWEIQPLKEWGQGKMASFIQRYVDLFTFGTLSPSECETLEKQLLDELQSIPEYTPFLSNPFLVSMFVFRRAKTGDLTNDIYTTVCAITEDLISRFNYAYGHDPRSPRIERADYTALLSQLAFEMCDVSEIEHSVLIDTLSELDTTRKVNWSSIKGDIINSQAGILIPARDKSATGILYQFQARETIVPLLAAHYIFNKLHVITHSSEFLQKHYIENDDRFEKSLRNLVRLLSDKSMISCAKYVVAVLKNGLGRKGLEEHWSVYGSNLFVQILIEKIDDEALNEKEHILHTLKRVSDPQFAATCYNTVAVDPDDRFKCMKTVEAIRCLAK